MYEINSGTGTGAALLGRLGAVAMAAGCSISWGHVMGEVNDAIAIWGEEVVASELDYFGSRSASKGYKFIDWHRFKAYRLDVAPTLQQRADAKELRDRKHQSPAMGVHVNKHPLPNYDLDAWQIMREIQAEKIALTVEVMDKLHTKWLVYPDGAMRGRVKQFIDDYLDGVDVVAEGKKSGEDPSMKALIEVIVWYNQETKVVPEHFRTLIDGIKDSRAKAAAERKLLDRLGNPLPVKKKPIGNLLEGTKLADAYPTRMKSIAEEHASNVAKATASILESAI